MVGAHDITVAEVGQSLHRPYKYKQKYIFQILLKNPKIFLRCRYITENIPYIGWIRWKLQNHYFSKKIFFSKYVYDVFLVTDEFWIKWIFQKNAVFCPKNAFFLEKWLFDPRCSALQRRCLRSFFLGHIFIQFFDEMKTGQDWAQYVRPIFPLLPAHFLQFLVKRSLKNDFWH